MKKKILWICLLVCTLTGLAACGGEDTPTGSVSGSSQNVSVSESSEESSTDSSEDGVEEYCTVTFDSDGGSEVDSVRVEKGEKLTPPQTPTKSSADNEYEFLGWYQGDTEWNFEEDSVKEDMTLTAKWQVSDSYTKPFLPKD